MGIDGIDGTGIDGIGFDSFGDGIEVFIDLDMFFPLSSIYNYSS